MEREFDPQVAYRTGLPEFLGQEDVERTRRALGGLVTAQEAVVSAGDGLADMMSTLVGGPALRFAGVSADVDRARAPIPRNAWGNSQQYVLAA